MTDHSSNSNHDPLPAAAAALTAEDRANLVNAHKDELHLSSEQRVDIRDKLSSNVRKRVEALRDLQSQHDMFEIEFQEERALLGAKYQKLYEPLYTKRYEIVNGVYEVEGITKDAVNDEEDKATEEKGVPDFWLTVLTSNEILDEEITTSDEEALKYLNDIKCSRLENDTDFKLEFYFDTNPYFKNSVLTKTYLLVDDDDDPLLVNAIGTEIEWYPGKRLTQKIIQKKPINGSDHAKPITKTEENCASFFDFFRPPQIPEEDESFDDDALYNSGQNCSSCCVMVYGGCYIK